MRGKTTRYTYEEVKIIVNNLGYKLISEKYSNTKIKLILEDVEGYLYFVTLCNLISCRKPSKFEKRNPYTIQNIKLWCKLNNKPFILIDNQIYQGNTIKLKWQCLKDGCQEIFSNTWNDIFCDHGCGVCSGNQVTLSNCLATKNPELAKEFHPTFNGDLTPWNVTSCSSKEVWWLCHNNSKHIWKTSINNRNNTNCPYCSGKVPSEEYNLLVCNPGLCGEWNYDKNKKNPEEYCPNANQEVWWKCKECGNEWFTQIAKRNNNRGCPECNKSKGEKECKRVFISKEYIEIIQEEYDKLINKNNNIYFIPQKTFKNLLGVGNGLLSYDFYLPKYNLLIEYQGEYHDGTAGNQTPEEFRIQQEHDRRKKEYALSNGYNFLEIWYYDFNNIEEILTSKLEEVS